MYSVLQATPAINRMLKKYDFNTETISTVIVADLKYDWNSYNHLCGVESGGQRLFIMGYLYLGIETSNGSQNQNREAIVWRLDFNASNIPYRASQVFATPVDNGAGDLIHDWAISAFPMVSYMILTEPVLTEHKRMFMNLTC